MAPAGKRPAYLFVLVAGALAAQPARIVSTAPSVTETLYALGLGDRVVAVSNYCRYPPEAAAKPKIGSYLQPNVEAIAALRPDLVIVEQLPGRVAPQLERLKLDVLEVKYGGLEQNLAVLQAIAGRAGARDKGAGMVRRIRERLRAIRDRTEARQPRRVVFIVGRTPGRLEGIIAVGKGSYLNELMAIAGGRNALAGNPLAYAKISLESLIALDPDVILDMGDMADPGAAAAAGKESVLELWRKTRALRAVREKQVHVVDSEVFVVPGPRMADAAEMFARWFQR